MPLHLRILNLAASALLVIAVAALIWPQSAGGGSAFVMVSGVSMQPTMHSGDLVVVRETSRGYRAGDIVAFRVPAGEAGAGAVVIHRVVGGNGRDGYVLQGDNRREADRWHPVDADVLGRRMVLVPHAGHLVEGLRSPAPLGAVAGLGTVLIGLSWPRRRQDTTVAQAESPTAA